MNENDKALKMFASAKQNMITVMLKVNILCKNLFQGNSTTDIVFNSYLILKGDQDLGQIIVEFGSFLQMLLQLEKSVMSSRQFFQHFITGISIVLPAFFTCEIFVGLRHIFQNAFLSL